MSLSIPPTWPVSMPNDYCGELGNISALEVIGTYVATPNCGGSPLTAKDAAHDGTYLFVTPPYNGLAPRPTGQPLATLQHGPSTISIFAAQSDPNSLDLLVHNSGSKFTHALILGLGRDGRVAADVLGSVEATT